MDKRSLIFKKEIKRRVWLSEILKCPQNRFIQRSRKTVLTERRVHSIN